MPKVKTPQQVRETKAKVELGLLYDKEVAAMIGVDDATYGRQKKQNFQVMKLGDFSRMARMLHFSGKDVCAIIGVPMDGD